MGRYLISVGKKINRYVSQWIDNWVSNWVDGWMTDACWMCRWVDDLWAMNRDWRAEDGRHHCVSTKLEGGKPRGFPTHMDPSCNILQAILQEGGAQSCR